MEREPEKSERRHTLREEDLKVVRMLIARYRGRPYPPGYPHGVVNRRREAVTESERGSDKPADNPNHQL